MCKKLLSILTVLLLASCQSIRHGYVGSSGDSQIYYEQYGEGTPLLLLHGHSLDTRMWKSQIKDFSSKYRVICLDFRGYGRSSAQTEQFQFTHMQDVITLMDTLHIEKAHVVGLSMGGFIAADMLAMHPERMLSCVIASGGLRHSPGPSTPMDDAEKKKRDQEIEQLKIKGVDKMKSEWIDALVASGGSNKESIRKPLTKMVKDWTAWQPLHKEVRLIVGEDAWKQLKRVRPEVPTLFITGAVHRDASKPYHPKELDYLQDAKAVVLPDCGHMMNMEQPKLFNETVLDFIATVKSNGDKVQQVLSK